MILRVLAGLVCLCAISASTDAGDLTVEWVNHQPFDIHQPVKLKGLKVSSDQSGAQQWGDDAVVIANAPASQTTPVKLGEVARSPADLKLESSESGIRLLYKGKDVGTLAWDVIVRPADPDGAVPPSTKRNFDQSFEPLALKFEQSGQGPLFDIWTARAEKKGVELTFELHAYHAGFLDTRVTFTNRSAPTTKVYAAVLCRWDQPAATARSVNYNNGIINLSDAKSTPFRQSDAAGDQRHLYVQRGIDWINTKFQGASVAWLNDFTPSFTVHKEATAKAPARWLGANTAQLGQEAQVSGNKLYSITEIARPNLRSYRSRLDDNVLPQPGEDPLTIVSRLIFSDSTMTDQQVDQQFIAMTSFRHQEQTDAGAGAGIRYTFGVPFTRFGTNYFPYSTLGENFITQRLPNMSKEGYWPLAPETVNQWPLFKDDIKRDLRILKAMGFVISRLHHLELLWDKDPKTNKPYVDPVKRDEYLDFYFAELKHLGLKALLDIKVSPEETAELVTRYRDLVEGVEIDNEVILFMLPDADVQYWKDVYAAVKKVAPEIPIHLTGHTNTGAFNRLLKMDVPFDKVGAHAYMDSIAAIGSSRDYALAVSDYASELNKEPVITEWNWRFLTRMTFEDRAKVYPPIYENVLKTRCMPTMYQFQFQDSLAMNPTTLKGMRRYEQILLSRRPKPEAFEMMKLIKKYAAPDHPNRLLDVPLLDVEADDQGNATLNFEVTDISEKQVQLLATVEPPEGVQADSEHKKIMLGPKGTWFVPVQVALGPDAKPGFYHVFLRVDVSARSPRYGWGIVRKLGKPDVERIVDEKSNVTYAAGALDFDLDRPLTVVYGKDCTPLELESAWTLFITLESATGRVVEIFQDDQLEQHGQGRILISVGALGSFTAPTVQLDGDRLVVTGKTPEQTAQAAMDLTLRYWKNAKDSACRRVGLVEQPSGKAGVKTDLE